MTTNPEPTPPPAIDRMQQLAAFESAADTAAPVPPPT